MSIDADFVIILANKFGYLEKRVTYLEGKCRGQQGLIEELLEKLKNVEKRGENQDRPVEGQVFEDSVDLKPNLDSIQISNKNLLEGTFEVAAKTDKKLNQKLIVQMGVRVRCDPLILHSNQAKVNQIKTQNNQKAGKNVKISSKSKRSRKQVKKSHICSYCSKYFRDLYTLSIHKRIHTGERPFKCKICSRSFNRVGNLKTHSLVHTGEKPYSCTFCSKSFGLLQTRNYHIMTHTGEKPYSCSICSKSFIRIQNLNDHLRTHTGERPYFCPVCPKTFAQSSNLRAHKKRQCMRTEKPNSCSI